MPTDDDEARRAARGSTERVTGTAWPKVPTPGIPLGKLPPAPARVPVTVQRKPPYLQSGEDPPEPATEPTRPDVPLARQAQRRATLTGSPAPPSGDTTLQSAPEYESTPPSGQVPPLPHGVRRQREETLVGLGATVPESPPARRQEPTRSIPPVIESTWSEKFGSPGAPSPSLVARAERIPLARWLVLIAATGATLTGIITATGQVVVNILTASRPASVQQLRDELEPRIHAVEERAKADWGLSGETKARAERDDELETKIGALRTKLEATPVPVIQGLKPQK